MTRMGEMKERMLRGELYIADDPDLGADNARAQVLLDRYNATLDGEHAERDRLLRELLGEVGEGVVVKPSFRCDYGTYIAIGAGTFVNYDCVMLDVAPIAIGAACSSPRACSSSRRPTLSTRAAPAPDGSRGRRSSFTTTSGSAGASSSAPA